MENQTEQKFKQSGVTIEDLMKKKTPWEKIKNFPFAIVPVSLWLVLLLVISSFFWKSIISWQRAIMIFVSLLSVINLCLCLMTKHTDEINKYKPHLFWTLTIFSIVIVSISAFTIQWKVSGNISQIIWLVFIVFICITNILVTMRKRDGMNSIENTIKQLKFIEIIASVIALLQLIIAIPQMQQSFKTATSDDIKELQKLQKELYEHTQQFVMVNIPDSLQNEEVKKAKKFQMELYTLTVGISSLPISIINIDNLVLEDEISQAMYIYDYLGDEIEIERIRIGYLKRAINLSKKIVEEYSDTIKYPDISKYAMVLIKKNDEKNIENELDYEFIRLLIIAIKLEDTKNQMKDINKNINNINSKKAKKKILKLSMQNYKNFNEVLNVDVQKKKIDCVEEVIFKIIKALNFIQLYHAYGNDIPSDGEYHREGRKSLSTQKKISPEGALTHQTKSATLAVLR